MGWRNKKGLKHRKGQPRRGMKSQARLIKRLLLDEDVAYLLTPKGKREVMSNGPKLN